MAQTANNNILGIDHDGKPTIFVVAPEPLAEGGEGRVFRTVDKQHIIKVYWPHIQRKADSIMEILAAGPKDTDPARELLAWPTHVLPREDATVGGVVVPNASTKRWMEKLIWYTSPKVWLGLEPQRRGNFRGFVKVALEIVSAIRFLNLSGYGHADLSGNNILCNPVDGRAVVIDLDGLVVPNYMTGDVIGTPGYIAPELVEGLITKNYVLPSAVSDRHALAVLLFQLLLWRHPLLGGQRQPLHPEAQMDDLLRTSPKFAIYVHHPVDTSNRPVDPHIPVHILGDEIVKLFERTFVDGIHTPQQRPHPSEWEAALQRLETDLTQCANPNCLWGYFPSKRGQASQCPACGQAVKREAIAKLKIIKGKNGFYSKKKIKAIDLYQEQSLPRSQLFNASVPKSQSDALSFSYQQSQWIMMRNDKNSDLDICILNPHTGKRQKLNMGESFVMNEAAIAIISLNGESCMLHLEV